MEITNRKARYNYDVLDTYTAGIVLVGSEVKSIKNGNANIEMLIVMFPWKMN